MTYQPNPSLWNGVFAVPTAIADEHLKLCSDFACKAILWILRHPGEENDAETLAAIFHRAPDAVADSLSYWEEKGVLLKNGAAPAVTAPVPADEPKPAAEKSATKPLVSRLNRPHYPREEAVSIVEREPTLASLMEEGQSVMGKAFTSADLDSLVALYSYYGLSAHFILTAMHYCRAIGRSGVAYVESVCAAWLNDGVTDDSVGETVDSLMRRRTNEGLIRREFGIGERRLTAREKDCVACWFDSYHMPLELIVLAYEKAVENTGKVSFSYIHTILTAWSKKQIDTVEKAKEASLPPQRKTKAPTPEDKNELMQRLAVDFLNEQE